MITFRQCLAIAAIPTLLGLSGCIFPPTPVYQGTVYGAQPAPEAAPSQPYTPAPQYYASFCSAGVYQCPIPSGTPVGTSCACPGLGAPSYGVAQ